MDYLAHALWSYGVYNKSAKPWWGVFWGVFPDTISWVPFFFYSLLSSGGWGRPVVASLPEWVYVMYGLSHSLVVFTAVFALVYFFNKKKVPIYLLSWLIHICIDVPSHAREFLPTPFLWPVSEWRFPGVSWGTPWFALLNYVLLAGFFIYLIYERRKNKFFAT